jgi:DNA recombination protein RmuC
MEHLNLIISALLISNLIIGILIYVKIKRPEDGQNVLKDFQQSIQNEVRTESLRLEKANREDLGGFRKENQDSARDLRTEITTVLKSNAETLLQFKDSINKSQTDLGNLQKGQLESFSNLIQQMTKNNDERQVDLRNAMDKRLQDLQLSNEKKLDEMRITVDEKLHGTLEKRLGESFKQVSERLEQVHKGLGEMQNLAVGVGDLKKVLTNVKTRGTWGEIQLEALLEDMLTPDQYEKNVQVRPRSQKTVEFAIKLPGNSTDQEFVWLPIDAKFPKEDYERLLQAQDEGNKEAADAARTALGNSVESFAMDIRDKYVHPPYSVDFGILFLPVESLYAEVLRQPGLVDKIQQKHRVTIAGPTTLAALLTSLRMGFRSLAIQKSTSEVWKVLGAVKTEFMNFGILVDKAQTQLGTVQKTLEKVGSKSRTITRKLKGVEGLDSAQTIAMLGTEAGTEEPIGAEEENDSAEEAPDLFSET